MFRLDKYFSLGKKIQGKQTAGAKSVIFETSSAQIFLPHHMEYFLRKVLGLSGNSICYNAKAQKCERYDCLAGDHVTFRE